MALSEAALVVDDNRAHDNRRQGMTRERLRLPIGSLAEST